MASNELTNLQYADGCPLLLVIDDDPINRALMHRLFDHDFTLLGASSGKAGLELLQSHDVDVVLLDIMMPDMNGFEVLQSIRSNPKTADLPVILISSLTESESVVQGLQAGANDYLTKPINLHVARARLNTQVKMKRLLDEQKRTVAQLEYLSQIRERFFRIASHDLKNPLNNLRLAAYELGYFVSPTPETESLQNAMTESIGEMQDLIEEFLDVAAMRSGKIELTIAPTSFNECITQVVAQYVPAAQQKDIVLAVEPTSALVMADQQRLTQVIANLLSNALKFSPRGKTVSLWTEMKDDNVRLMISDEGPGVAADEQDKLFREFSRASARPTGGESSTGLGLWIVKHLMSLMHGSVGLDSEVGAGSVFWIELPAHTLKAFQTNEKDRTQETRKVSSTSRTAPIEAYMLI